MKKEESDLKIMEEMERKELQDRYIRFDWAIKRLLRQKANFDVLDGFLTVMLNEEIKILEYLKDGTIRPDTTVPGLKEAREKLKFYSMSPAERLVYIRHLEDINIQNNAIYTSKLEGIAEGKAEGLEEGEAKGKAEGMRQVAIRLKDTGVDIAIIVKCTGLSEETIRSL